MLNHSIRVNGFFGIYILNALVQTSQLFGILTASKRSHRWVFRKDVAKRGCDELEMVENSL